MTCEYSIIFINKCNNNLIFRLVRVIWYYFLEYDEIVAGQLHGDSFYVKTNFAHDPTPGQAVKDALSFKSGEIFHVVDTLHNGAVGQWLGYRLGRNQQEIQKGVIPNASRADEYAQEQSAQLKKDKELDSRSSFFKRRGQRRSKSLIKVI